MHALIPYNNKYIICEENLRITLRIWSINLFEGGWGVGRILVRGGGGAAGCRSLPLYLISVNLLLIFDLSNSLCLYNNNYR